MNATYFLYNVVPYPRFWRCRASCLAGTHFLWSLPFLSLPRWRNFNPSLTTIIRAKNLTKQISSVKHGTTRSFTFDSIVQATYIRLWHIDLDFWLRVGNRLISSIRRQIATTAMRNQGRIGATLVIPGLRLDVRQLQWIPNR